MELFAVFSSPQSYAVQTGSGQSLGTLTQEFVDRLVDGVSSFLLGGRAWAVLRVQHEDRRVVVESAPRGKQPTWGGFLPQFLGREVCQRIQRVLRDQDAVPYLDEAAAVALVERREAMRDVLSDARNGIEVEEGEVRWWTFAGGRINATLRYALQVAGDDWQVIADNFLIKVRGERLDERRFREVLARVRELEFWEDNQLWARVAASLPSYRLSKFQPLMPPWVEREVIAGHLLDVAGAWQWLTGVEGPFSRVPETVRSVTPADHRRIAELEAAFRELPRLERDPSRPVVWVTSDEELAHAVRALTEEDVVGLDVETALSTQAVCLIQVASRRTTYLIDALVVTDLVKLEPLLGSERTVKVIHYAAFERSVLGRQGLEIAAVVDTLEESRRARGVNVDGGHSLRSVCARELQVDFAKTLQASDWTQRPLTSNQENYAASDAEALLLLYDHFKRAAKSVQA